MRVLSTSAILFVLAAYMFVGCSKSDKDNTDENTLVPMNVGAYISNARSSGANWNNGDAIGITMFKKGTFNLAEGAFVNKRYITADGTTGSFSAADNNSIIYFPKDGSFVDFMSYYPYSAAMTEDYILPLDISDQSVLPNIDLMTAQHISGDSKATPSVRLHFTHKLSMMIVNLRLPVGEDVQRLVGSKVTISGMYTKGDYKLNNNTTGVDINTSSVANLALTSNSSGAMAAAIVFPRVAGSGITFHIDLLDGGTYTATMGNDLELKSGYQYTFNITLQKTPIDVIADIEEWLTGTTSILDAH